MSWALILNGISGLKDRPRYFMEGATISHLEESEGCEWYPHKYAFAGLRNFDLVDKAG